MNKISITLFLLLTIMTACGAPESEMPTQMPIASTSTPSQPSAEMFTVGDGGLISGQPCASPCFFGIRVGETPLNQVIPTLKTNDISPCYQIDETNILCSNTEIAHVSVTINRSTLIVDGVGYDPSVSISVQDIIEKYGDPNLMQIELDRTNGSPESPILLVSLFWDQIKMGVALPEKSDVGEKIYVIENTTDIKWISLFDDLTYSKIISRELSKPWKGYGAYKP